MAEPINLRRERKRSGREEKRAKAAENRQRFGRSRAEKASLEQQQRLEERRIEGHRRSPAEAPSPDRPDG